MKSKQPCRKYDEAFSKRKICGKPVQPFKAELMDKGAFECFEDAYTEIFNTSKSIINESEDTWIDYQIPDQLEQR